MNQTTPQKVLITGAMGFIGSAIMQSFKAQGVNVIGVDLHGNDDDIFAADVGNPQQISELLKGVDVIIHTAALVSNALADAQMWRVNVQSTATLINAAKTQGVRRFVQISSIVVYGNAALGELHEDRPVHADGGSYVQTKLASEHSVLQAHASGSIETTIVRLGDVYGPGSRPWIVEPLQAMNKNQFALPENGMGKFRPVYIDDVVRGICLAATVDDAGGQIINLCCKGAITTAEYFAWHANWLGKSKPMALPTWVMVGVASIISAIAKITGKPNEVNPATMYQLSTYCWLNIDKAESILGWKPEMPLADGMELSRQWAQEQGYLSKQ